MARPKKILDNTTEAVVKKGTRAKFAPSNQIGDFGDIPSGHVPRWVRNDPKNIYNKMKEGWIPLNEITSPGSSRRDSQDPKAVNDSSPLGTAGGYKELIKMVLPEELRESRREYYEQETREMTESKMQAKSAKSQTGNKDVIRTKFTID